MDQILQVNVDPGTINQILIFLKVSNWLKPQTSSS